MNVVGYKVLEILLDNKDGKVFYMNVVGYKVISSRVTPASASSFI